MFCWPVFLKGLVTGSSWKENKFKMVNTPGHIDFGSKVERVVRMVEEAVLVVEVSEGPFA